MSQRKPRVSLEIVVTKLSSECVKGDAKSASASSYSGADPIALSAPKAPKRPKRSFG